MVTEWNCTQENDELEIVIVPPVTSPKRRLRNIVASGISLSLLVALTSTIFSGEQFHVVLLFYASGLPLWAYAVYWERNSIERVKFADKAVDHEIRRPEGKRIGAFPTERITEVRVWNFRFQGRIFLMYGNRRQLVFAYDLDRDGRRELGRRVAEFLDVPLVCYESLAEALKA